MIEQLILKIKRGDSPVFRLLRRTAFTLLHNTLPVPGALRPFFRAAYRAHFGIQFGVRWFLAFFYRGPLFQARCASVGKNLHVWLLPEVRGPVEIHLGDHVNVFGYALIESRSLGEAPKLLVGDRVDLGHNMHFVVNREVVIEDDVKIASGVRIWDSDEFSPDDSRPVRICRYAWIGQNSYILKGVTLGEGSIVGVNSVVTGDIPPYSVAMGNPARVVVKNINKTAPEPAAQTI